MAKPIRLVAPYKSLMRRPFDRRQDASSLHQLVDANLAAANPRKRPTTEVAVISATGWPFGRQPGFGRSYSMQISRFGYNRQRCHPSIPSFRNRFISKKKRAHTFEVRTLPLCGNSLGAEQLRG
jgi:hypothetical protein